jgi:hypothetical protein
MNDTAVSSFLPFSSSVYVGIVFAKPLMVKSGFLRVVTWFAINGNGSFVINTIFLLPQANP